MEWFWIFASGGVLFFLGPIGFFIAIGHGRRIVALERQIAALRQDLTGAAAAVPSARPERAAFEAPGGASRSQPRSEAQADKSGEERIAPQPSPAAPEPSPPAPEAVAEGAAAEPTGSETEAAARPRPGFEEALGTRWTVWVGGAALALGAVLLVRYSVEQGYLGPGARVLLGLVVSAALVCGGEFLRHREAATAHDLVAGVDGAYIPGVLTAAGVTGAFGAIYAAHGLYGFIDAGPAFVGLGLVALAAIAAALIHGPALAGLGLVGALATPLLVSSARPNPWPVVLYLAVVVSATYALARLRLWLWLALAAALGGALWTLLLVAGIGSTGAEAAYASLVVQLALTGLAFGVLPHRGESDESAEIDRVASIVLIGLALIAIVVLAHGSLDAGLRSSWVVAAVAATAVLAVVGLKAAPAAAATGAAGLVVLAAMRLWPSAHNAAEALGAPAGTDLVPGPNRIALAPFRFLIAPYWPTPQNVAAFVGVSTLAALGVAALAAWRLRSGDRLKAPLAAMYAGTATLTPLGAVAVADMRLADGKASGAMALAAALIAAAFVSGAGLFRDGFPREAPPAVRIGLGVFSAGAVAGLSSGLVFALDGGALTVSLALAALASAFVADRLELPALRWSVAALGLVTAGRLACDPRIVGAALSPTPIFNWLLFGYGVPAASFAYAGRLLHRQVDDLPTRAADTLAVLFATFLIFFEIRHAMNGGDPFAPTYGLVESGLMSVSALGFALGLTRLDAASANVVFRWASLAAGALGVAVSTLGLLLLANPFFTGTPVEGGVVVNALIVSYLLPAALALALAISARRSRPKWYWAGAAAVAAAVGLAYLLLQNRVVFHGSDIGWDEGFTLGETGVAISILLLSALALARFLPGAAAAVKATKALVVVALIGAAAGLGAFVNPMLTGDPIGGGVVLNALILGYAAPAALFAALARSARGFGRRLQHLASAGAILLVFVYATIETRRAFHGSKVGLDLPTSDAEVYAYSAVWLLLGLALLAYGMARKSVEARLASAFFIIATTLKVFAFDLSGLEGALRALSFLGLGVALIGIGLVYQRFVFAKARPREGVPPARRAG
jgi:uncharacterized membrane protein